jgi:hypothetical protein
VATRQARAAAIGGYWQARAARVRRRAAALRRQADRLDTQPPATDAVVSRPAADASADGPDVWLRRRAARLDCLAARLEGRPSPAAGRIVAGSVAELITRLTANPLRIAPPVSAVLAWAAASSAAWARVMGPLGAAGAAPPRLFELVWHDGTLDLTRSRVGTPRLLERSTATAGHDGRRSGADRPLSPTPPAAGCASSDRVILALVDQLARRRGEDTAHLRHLLGRRPV